MTFTERIAIVKRTSSSLLLALLACALPAAALERQGADLFAGYSYVELGDSSRHGADLALGFDLFGPLSGFVDASGHGGGKDGVDLSDLTLMAGPGLRFGRRGGTVLFVRALAGLVEDRASISVLDVEISEKSRGFGVLAGGGIDVRVAKQLALRVQGDYLWHEVETGEKASGYRAAVGVVWRLGAGQ